MRAPFPWQRVQWEALRSRLCNQRVPHALLLFGPAGVGKNELGRLIAKTATCQALNSEAEACGACKACVLFEAGTHPDVTTITPEGQSNQIRVDQIRELKSFLALSRHYGRFKVAVITPADDMNVYAANSLLKMLEEPPALTLLILVSAHPARLLATIRSRCHQIRLPIPNSDVARSWLQSVNPQGDHALSLMAAHGAPLLALEMMQGTLLDSRQDFLCGLKNVLVDCKGWVELAESAKDIEVLRIADWLESLLRDLILMRMECATRLENPALAGDLQASTESLDLKGLFRLQDKMLVFRRLSTTSVNQQLLIEDILSSWQSVFVPARTTHIE